uniref:IGF1_0 protein n=1 Tax=Fopius arisanus TaxID=64838 RepID=A0A0C9RDF3_9HYME
MEFQIRFAAFEILNSTLLVILVLSMHWCAEGAPQMIRLCSKSLSDALYLTCMGRGYQDFITYSDGLDPKVTLGTGLVEECCHQPCTYKQLEQYCKPLPSEENSNSRIEESLRIVNLPYSSRRTVTKEGAEDEVQIKNSIKEVHEESP